MLRCSAISVIGRDGMDHWVEYLNVLNSLSNVLDVLASTLSADTHAKSIFTILKNEIINNEMNPFLMVITLFYEAIE